MASNTRKQIQIWITAFDHLRKVSEAFKARGELKALTSIASEAILQIPVPVNGNGGNGVVVPDQEGQK